MDRYDSETFLKRNVPIKGGGEKTAVHSERDRELSFANRIIKERDRNMTDLENRVASMEQHLEKIAAYMSGKSEVKERGTEEVSTTTTTTPAITLESDLTKIRGVAEARAIKLREFGAATIGDVANLEQNKATAKKAGIPWVQFEGLVMEAKAMITATPTENAFGKKSWEPSQEGNLETKVHRMTKDDLARTLAHLIDTEQYDEAKRVSAIVAKGKIETKAATTPKTSTKAKEREAKLVQEFSDIKIETYTDWMKACVSLDRIFFPSKKRNPWKSPDEQKFAYLHWKETPSIQDLKDTLEA